jgi:hypothetical protein
VPLGSKRAIVTAISYPPGALAELKRRQIVEYKQQPLQPGIAAPSCGYSRTLARDPSHTPSEPLQRQHCCHLIRRAHLTAPRRTTPRSSLPDLVHEPSIRLGRGVQFFMSSGVQFYVSPDRRLSEVPLVCQRQRRRREIVPLQKLTSRINPQLTVIESESLASSWIMLLCTLPNGAAHPARVACTRGYPFRISTRKRWHVTCFY